MKWSFVVGCSSKT